MSPPADNIPAWAVQILVRLERVEATTSEKFDGLTKLIMHSLDSFRGDIDSMRADIDGLQSDVTELQTVQAELRGATKFGRVLWGLAGSLVATLLTVAGLLADKFL